MKKDELPYGHPLWGLSEEPGIPSKGILFTSRREGFLGASTAGMEDFLHSNNVFVNGIRNTPCHSDSYMTVVDFKALDAALAVLAEHYSPTADDWRPLVQSWLESPNMRPPLTIVALIAAGRAGIPEAETNAMLAYRKNPSWRGKLTS